MNSEKNITKKLNNLFIQEEVVHAIRQFFREQEFHEIITPILNDSLPLEPNLYAFETTWHKHDGQQKMYLPTSPESTLKKLLAQGIGNCFALGKSFRNLESSGTKHWPEFLMLEWYREHADYTQIMKDVRELILYTNKNLKNYKNQESSENVTYQGQEINLGGEWPTLSLVDLFETHAKINIMEILSDEALFAVAKEKGYSTENTNWGELFDQIFLNEVEPHLPSQPFFLVDFPARMSPLCTPRKDKPYLAQRFEIFINKIELGNGNTENTDVETIKKIMLEEQAYRKSIGLEVPPIDEEFLQALTEMQNKSYAGIGLGVDRLVMLFTDSNSI